MFPESLVRHVRLFGLMGLIVSVTTWGMDVAGWVYVCPYCRIERSVVGLLGLLLLLPAPGHWLSRYLGTVLATIGLVIGVIHFSGGLKEVMTGEFSWDDPWYLDSFLLSGCAIFILVGQILLIHQANRQ